MTYLEVLTYEDSATSHGPTPPKPSAFQQFVFDNADHNVRTVDEFGTFHAMGGIMCVTPKESIQACEPISRFKERALSKNNGRYHV